MNLNPREWEWPVDEYSEGAFLSFLIGTLGGGFVSFLAGCGLNQLLYFVLPTGAADAISITFFVTLWIFFIMSWWWLPRINKVWPVNRMLRHIALRYLALPKEDRAEFPKNFLKSLSDSRLSYEQERQILLLSDDVFRQINKRNEERARLASESVDIDGILDNLTRARQLIASDVRTYKELG